MKSNQKKALIDKYSMFYLVCSVLAIILIVTAVVLTVVYQRTSLGDELTIIDLFMLFLLLVLAFASGMVAIYYHRLVFVLKLSMKDTKKRKGPRKANPAKKKTLK